MNFLLRTHPVAPELPTVYESFKDMKTSPQPVTTVEGLISEDPFARLSSEDGERDNDDTLAQDNADGVLDVSNQVYVGKYSDVTEDEGWITIPFKELPENWSTASDIESFRSLDRSFVFPGEQIHILACLAASKQDIEVITPFKVAALMSRNSSCAQNTKHQRESKENALNSASIDTDVNSVSPRVSIENTKENGGTPAFSEEGNTDVEKLIRMEDYRHQTEILLKRFTNSHFFVRIAEVDELLWSKRSVAEGNNVGTRKTSSSDNIVNSVIDRGHFDGNNFGGVARNTVRCCSLHSGDIVVLLEVNVGIRNFKDPILEVFQFEKYPVDKFSAENDQAARTLKDPCGELLKWLLPLDRTLPLPARPLSPPLTSVAGVGSTPQRSMSASSSSSQFFSFGDFRSYSMSTLPQTSANYSSDILPPNSKPSIVEDFDYFEESPTKSQVLGAEGHLSFRGVQLEPERYFVQCGLGGMYLPGKRWRRKLEIIQPIEIQSFAAECNTEDLLCVHIKNVSPDHIPDIVVYVDAISVVFEEAPKSEEPLSLPLSCIEAGNDHCLPNLALRRGEEHGFILKPATLMARDLKNIGDKSFPRLQSHVGTSGTNKLTIPKMGNGRNTVTANQYAILVSFRCNYTESKLFLKKPTNWRPRVMRNLMISVSSEVSERTLGPAGGGISQLPIQELTLQATNSTDEDLTLTVLAPASATAPPSVVSMNSAPATPITPCAGFPEVMGRIADDKRGGNINIQKMSSMPVSENQNESDNDELQSTNSLSECTAPVPDVIQNSELGCTHLWLQSTVPLGCVPARSSAKVKLELLPLNDGNITLDTLQIAVKEKGLTFVPEYSLKIHATSSVTTGIL